MSSMFCEEHKKSLSSSTLPVSERWCKHFSKASAVNGPFNESYKVSFIRVCTQEWSKGQETSEGNFGVFDFPKITTKNVFRISALASK